MHNFQWERIGMALGAVRHAADVLDVMGRSATGELIAEVAATRALTYRALREYVAGQDVVRVTSMAKWYACDLSVRICEAAVDARGWSALARNRLERTLHDARLGPIGGGTDGGMKGGGGRAGGVLGRAPGRGNP